MSQKSLFWNQAKTPSELHSILETLAVEYPISPVNGEVELCFTQTESKGKSSVKFTAGKAEITYNRPVDAARAIGNALAGLESDEHTEFKTYGIMLDCSRNAVMTVAHFKKWLRRLALMGYNMAMLYTEDTYQLPGEPFFGYKRGPYTMAEMKEIDVYARALGIEMIACLQTLGHMEQILQWHNAYGKVRDTASVLLVDEDATYTLIDKMLAFWSEALSSRRIHIGMDETHDLGRGRFMDLYGYERGFDIFNRHFGKVEKMCEKYNLRPMIWSDMYFRMANPQQAYYDLGHDIPQDVVDMIPRHSDLVYWDYYHQDKQFYIDFIEKHREIGYEPLMGSGLWTWGRLWNDHEQDVKTVKPCLQACRETKLDEVFFTLWGDSGAFCEINSVLAGFCWAAELAYGGDENAERLEAQFRAIAGGSYKNHLTAAKLGAHILKNAKEALTVGAPFLLWDDPLLGICWDSKLNTDPGFVDKAVKLYDSICAELADQRDDNAAGDINHAWLYADFLRRKVAFRRDLLKAYESGDKAAMRSLADKTLPEMLASCGAVTASIRKMWHKYFKPFGLEVLQIRQGGQLLRLEEAGKRINEYLDGVIASIPELEGKTDQPTSDNVYKCVATGSTHI
ncbi:MAG: family 20 glycosylhydrolase [Victivallaceae bacterium]|nr:family 20 glycosylhydrolase [Victivallaceae bacterium]